MGNKKNNAVIFANLVLGSAVIMSILAIAYIGYRSTLLQIPFNFKFCILLIPGLLLSSISLFMRDKWKVNIAIALFSTIVALYSLETALYIHKNIKFSRTEVDSRNKLEVIEDLRSEGVDAWPNVLPVLFAKSNGLPSGNNRLFPLSGISHKTIVYCNESSQYKIFKSDEHGFNNPDGLYKKNSIQVALIGDSFVMGNCVKSEEEVSYQLRNRGISTINLGNGGNGPLLELAILNEYAAPVQPDIVLWVYYEGNDLINLERERKSSMLMEYLDENYSQNLLGRQSEIDSTLTKYVNNQWVKEMYRYNFQRVLVKKPQQPSENETSDHGILKLWHLRSRIGLLNISGKPQQQRIVSFKEQLTLFSKILTAARQRTSAWGGKIYFVYLPKMERYVNDNNNGSFYDRDDVLAIVNHLAIPLIDFTEVVNSHPDPLLLAPHVSAHYNASGYKLLSDVIEKRLRKDNLISN